MIYLQLAYRNLTRSLRDYAIYFFTVALSALIFYTFNSLKDQPVIVEFCRQAGMDTNILAIMLASTSVFVAFIVAALVLYSNNFIIRRRKRELGTYLLLGMQQSMVARMIFIETLAVGVAACLLGILAGILFSGVFSILFSLWMGIASPPRLFSFSLYSIILTSIFYVLIFTGVGIMSSMNISRYPLASLLAANRSNDVFKARSRWMTAVLGIISLAVLAAGYFLAVRAIASPNFNPLDAIYVVIAVLVTVGSLGFFYAGVGFIFDLLRRRDGFRWKGLNTFTMRQIMKKVNTNTLVLTATNLLLAIMITSVVFLVAFQSLFDQVDAEAIPYAYAVLFLDSQQDLSGFDRASSANPDNPVLRKLSITNYVIDMDASELILPEDAGKDVSIIDSESGACSAIRLSEYNDARGAKTLGPIQLAENEVAVQLGTGSNALGKKIQRAAARGLTLNLSSSAYMVKQVISQPFISIMAHGPCMLIVPDPTAANLSLENAQTALLFDYANGKDAIIEKSLEEEIYKVGGGYWTSKGEETAENEVIEAIIMFSGLFIEVILLIACASVLGLQQLMEAVESVPHYQSLHNLGVDERQISRSIFQQVTFYFFLPLTLAMVHSAFAIGAFNRLAGSFFNINPLAFILTFGSLLLVYGVYYLITWKNCARLVVVKEIAAPGQ